MRPIPILNLYLILLNKNPRVTVMIIHLLKENFVMKLSQSFAPLFAESRGGNRRINTNGCLITPPPIRWGVIKFSFSV